MTTSHSHKKDSGDAPTKKELILEAARALEKPRFTPAEIEQIRRQLISQLGAASGKTSADYIVSVLKEAGLVEATFDSASWISAMSLLSRTGK